MASHSGHSHDNTPSARATCRKRMAAGNGPAQADTPRPGVNPFNGKPTRLPADAGPTKERRTRKDPVTEEPIDPFEQAKANAIGQLAIWCAKALELTVDVSGPTPVGGTTMYVFKGAHGALVVSINMQGRIHIARVSERGLRSPVLHADFVAALEQIA